MRKEETSIYYGYGVLRLNALAGLYIQYQF